MKVCGLLFFNAVSTINHKRYSVHVHFITVMLEIGHLKHGRIVRRLSPGQTCQRTPREHSNYLFVAVLCLSDILQTNRNCKTLLLVGLHLNVTLSPSVQSSLPQQIHIELTFIIHYIILFMIYWGT